MRKQIEYIGLNSFEKILSIIFRKYTYKIYSKGVKDGINWWIRLTMSTSCQPNTRYLKIFKNKIDYKKIISFFKDANLLILQNMIR